MTYLNPADPFEEALNALSTDFDLPHGYDYQQNANQRAQVFATLAVAKAQLEVAEELRKLREKLLEQRKRGSTELC